MPFLDARCLQARSERHDRRRSIGAEAARGVLVRLGLDLRQSQAVRRHAGVVEQARAVVEQEGFEGYERGADDSDVDFDDGPDDGLDA
jgi:hypothetical protein